ncbi:MAG: ParB/RepB/Spo0J family partition protein [Planctomycetota bacterium]
MSKAARRLGRGLESLISNFQGTPAVAPVPMLPDAPDAIRRERQSDRTGLEDRATPAAAVPPKPTELPVDSLRPNPFQPRTQFRPAELESLKRSMQRNGVLQPVVVRKADNGYEIIAGERRWQAAKSLRMAAIPVVIRTATEEQMLELALIENLEREDLNPIDRASAYRQFCERFHLHPEEVADRVGEDRSTVVNYLRLLELDEAVRSMVASNLLSMGHARSLLSVRDPKRRLELAEAAARSELSVRALEEVVRRQKTKEDGQAAPPVREGRLRSPHLQDIERRFEQSIKTKVTIREGRRKGSGRITIEYYSLDDFDRVASLLGVSVD